MRTGDINTQHRLAPVPGNLWRRDVDGGHISRRKEAKTGLHEPPAFGGFTQSPTLVPRCVQNTLPTDRHFSGLAISVF